ncbi:MAG: ribonuclease HII [Atopobiaceae bacterium]|nr:ribonuclease HII [Atopobiaceae bacterium]MCH4213903.1 ribonuclease HII [Atopobiaceae bacterium]MCH4229848.1 ribonuclease HII [Atopobiaceae bacterium]MCI1227209.1 ribonuclease HII [Atopobiaceae bacterium]
MPCPHTAREVAAVLSDATYEEVDGLIARYSDDPRAGVRKAVATARRRHDRDRAERSRVEGMYSLMRELGGDGVVVGVDEVGRGAVAGPLTVGAVVLPDDPIIWGINDSKQLTPQMRERLAVRISEVAIAIGICHVPPETIDAVGMSAALRYAMSHAIDDTGVEPDCVLIDGNPVHAHPLERTLVKGDARIACIACASIVAKVTRDELMVSYDDVYPGYHLAESKGYASPEHIAAIRAHGLTDIHRASFCGNFLETPSLF